MFSTMPCLSSVWNVQATSAGIFARKLVSGLPSGSSGCLLAVELADRELAEDAHALAGVVVVRPAVLRPLSLVGSRSRMRIAWMSSFSYRPASAPCTVQLNDDVDARDSRSGPCRSANVAVTLPG